MTNPLADPYLVLLKVYKEGTYLKQAIAETPTEPLNRGRTVRICYGVVEKDCYLEKVIAFNTRKSPKLSVKLILKIAVYMLEFMGKHGYMVADCAVELARKTGKDGASGFVNAFLRSYSLPPESEGDEGIAERTSTPLWLVKKLKRSYKRQAEEILSAPSAGVCVRFFKDPKNYLSSPHIPTPFEGVYIFPNFVRDGGFERGEYTFQSVGSAAICDAVGRAADKELKGGGTLLDACSAPGGKAIALSAKFSAVVACDVHPHRVKLIESYALRTGVKNVSAQLRDGSVFFPEWEEKFDAVLVDAPCSGTGVINENPDIKLFRKQEDIPALAQKQLAILSNCARYVKRGGRLWYSTCSLLPEENDSVVYAFLQSTDEFGLEIPSSPLPSIDTGRGLQFLPNISLGAGFFLTGFIKK